MASFARPRFVDGRSAWTATWLGLGSGSFLALLSLRIAPYFAAAGLLGAIVAGWIVAEPILGFLLTSFVVPLERIGRFTNDSAVTTISLMRIVGTCTLAAVIINRIWHRRGFRFPLAVFLYAGYVCLLTVSVVKQDSVIEAVRGVSSMLANLVFLLLTVNVVETRQHMRNAILAWVLSTACIGVFTVYQYHQDAAVAENHLNGTGMRTTDERFSTVLHDTAEYATLGGEVKRAIGPTSAAAVYGINLVLALPFVFWLIRSERRWWAIALGVMTAAITAYNALLTNTRAVILTLIACVLLCVLFGILRFRASVWIGMGLLVILAVPFIPHEIYERALDTSNYSIERSASLRYRFIYWQTAVQLISENPWFGVGAGNQSIIPKSVTTVRMPPNTTAHNEYLNSLMEVGVPGFLVLVAFHTVLWRRLRAAGRRLRALGDQEGLMLVRCIMVAFISVLLFALQADVFHFPLKGWWLAMGLGLALEQLTRATSPTGGTA